MCIKYLFSILFFVVCLSGYGYAETLTIEQALDMAYEHNRDYLKAKKDFEKSKAQIVEARAGALPAISFAGEYNRNWEPSVFVITFDGQPQELKIGTDNSFSAGFNLTQPIYLGGRVGTALKIAKIYKKYSEQQLKAVYNEVRLDIYNRFYGYILAKELVRVAEQSYSLAKANREVVESMVKQGVASEYDLLRAKVAESNSLPALIQAKSGVATAADALKSALGVEFSEDIDPVESFRFTNLDTLVAQPVEYYQSMALERRADLKMLDYSIQMLDKNVSLEKSAYLPSLTFSTNLMWQLQRDDFDLDPDYWVRSINSAFSLQIPIFEGFGRSAKVKQARLDQQQAELSYQQLVDGVKLDVKSAHGDLSEAIERYSSQEETVLMAKEGLRISELRFKNGVGTQLEVMDARTALTQAETNFVNAKHDVIVSLAKFEKSIGIVKPEND